MSSAADKLTLHILSRRDIRSGGCYDAWDDPDRIAPLDPAKWRTLADNPLAGGDDEPVQIIGLCGKRVIGRMDMFPSVLTVDGQWLVLPVEVRDPRVARFQSHHDARLACNVLRGYDLHVRMQRTVRWRAYQGALHFN